MKLLDIKGIRVDRLSNSPAMTLREVDAPHRLIEIFIGSPEAASIHAAMEGAEMPRPLTHDLFVLTLERLQVEIRHVVLTEVRNGTYFAEMHLKSVNQDHTLSCRPSDAVAIAVRAECPVYATDELLDQVGEVADEVTESEILDEFKEFIDTIRPEDFEIGD
jgi:bifunctional DNase/RNase